MTPPGPDALLPATRRALLHRIATAQTEGRTPSLVAAVVRDGALVWDGGRTCVDGHAPDTDTQYRIGSITKTLIAVQVLRLRDEGLVDLADPLEKHLPGTQHGSATLAQLLSHTSGLAAEPRGPWWERTDGALRPELGALYEDRPTVHPPGRRFHYSNTGYAYLGALVAQLRGAPYEEVLRREVLEPLGMARTTPGPEAPHAGGWAVHPWADVMQPEPLTETGVMAPAGQYWSTTADLARWAAFLAAGDDRVLSAATLAEMREPAAAPQERDWDSSFGLGIQLIRDPARDEGRGRLLAGHFGSMPGFLAGVLIDVAEGLGAVALTNVTSGPAIGSLTADLIRIVAEHEPKIPDPWRPMPAAEAADADLLALTGPWYWGANPFALRLHADRALDLTPLGGRGRASRFRPEPDGTWTGLDGYYTGETLRPVRTEDGRVTHLDLATFVLTRQPYDPEAPVPGGTEGWQGL
ncbi:beta-lactamase family protein [Streptomyces sp. A7024]|uniref:Beta-lactamase family protein n=1 Tax=Streptomyces coryli TaxID=1128680 RepID=A0A6G4UCK7_9ACTN|nr:serine hydrolase domain-containing protein [Streptomyces coryli]NGN69949.1 beta-lactamase family protein [Streptomyces coryli]